MKKISDSMWVIASTFTAEPIIQPIQYVLKKFGYQASISLYPYGQMLQGLWNPESLFSINTHGVNVLLIRISDFYYGDTTISDNKLIANVYEFFEAISHFSKTFSSSLWVCICPEEENYLSLEKEFISWVEKIPNINIINSEYFRNQGFINNYFDREANDLGHIPFTQEGFFILAKAILRSYFCIYRKPYKVIIVDCDNTLWSGVCAENGIAGICVDESALFLQSFLLKQFNAGMLICLCSKNIEDDVFFIFDYAEKMLLKREHITAHRINWDSKVKNIKELSGLLDLSLDSFIFIDDNPVECAEVQYELPNVLTILLPKDRYQLPEVLKNIWAFDHKSITEDDQKRSLLYQQNFARNSFAQQYKSLTDFIENLNMKIDFSPISQENIARVSQLTFRTNQFNFTGLQWSEAEIARLIKGGYQFYRINVSDRFGDYGLVGMLAFTLSEDMLIIKNFALSCRVLGKGIEHKIFSKLAGIAKKNHMEKIFIEYQATNRNLPAKQFIDSLPSFEKNNCSAICFIGNLANLIYLPKSFAPPVQENSKESSINIQQRQIENQALIEIANEWSDLRHILPLVFGLNNQLEFKGRFEVLEKKIATIFNGFLKLKNISATENFFTLGGSSLAAVQILSKVSRTFSVQVALHEFFQNPTIKQLAQLVKNKQREVSLSQKEYDFQFDRDYPLSFSQQRLWFIDKLMPKSYLYNVSCAFFLEGNLNIDALKVAFNRLFAKHGVFRTQFRANQGEGKQFICQAKPFDLAIINLRGKNEGEIKRIILNKSQEPFDLERDLLFRAYLFTYKENGYILLMVSHHIIVDGWSWKIINQEIGYFYRAKLLNKNEEKKYQSFDYISYAIEQKDAYFNDDFKNQLLFWRKYLEELPRLYLPVNVEGNSDLLNYEGGVLPVIISSSITHELKKISTSLQVSLFTLLFSCFSAIIYKISQQKDFALGTVSTGRDKAGIGDVIGMFVNTLLVRVKINPNDLFLDFVKKMHCNLIEVLGNQDIPYEEIVKRILPRTHAEPIQAMMVLQKTNNLLLNLPEIEVKRYRLSQNVAIFPLLLELEEDSDQLTGNFFYHKKSYERKTIMQIMKLFNGFLGLFVQNKQLKLSEVLL